MSFSSISYQVDFSNRSNLAKNIKRESGSNKKGYIDSKGSILDNTSPFLEGKDSNYRLFDSIEYTRKLSSEVLPYLKLYEINYSTDSFKSIDNYGEGYVVSGNDGADVLVVYLDRNIDVEKIISIGGAYYDQGAYAKTLLDGSVLFIGQIRGLFGNSDKDFCATKFNSNKEIVWSIVVTGGYDAKPKNILELDNGYIVYGYFSTGASNEIAIAFHLSTDGNLEWCRSFNSNSGKNRFSAGIETSQGKLVFAGLTTNFGDDLGGFIVQMNQTGTVETEKKLENSSENQIQSIMEWGEKLFFFGYTSVLGNKDVFILTTDLSLNHLDYYLLGWDADEIIYSGRKIGDHFFLLGETFSINDGNKDGLVMYGNFSGSDINSRVLEGENSDTIYDLVQIESNNFGFVVTSNSWGGGWDGFSWKI